MRTHTRRTDGGLRPRSLDACYNFAHADHRAPHPTRFRRGPVPAPGGWGRMSVGSPLPAEGGFEDFVRAHQNALVAFLSKRANVEDARDAAQDAMARLMRYRHLPHAQLRPLMYRIALNTLNDRHRRDAVQHTGAHVSFDEGALGLPSTELTHEDRIANEQQLRRVRETILKLPPRCRQVYLLNRVEGMSYAEVARHCGISVKAVEKHIGKALQATRALLSQTPPGDANENER